MKIVFLADARSPIAINWVRWFTETAHADVHWISSRPAEPPLPGLASFRILPLFPSLPIRSGRSSKPPGALRLSALLRHWIVPLGLGRQANRLARMLQEIQPDLLHAMRIPLEGMAAAQAVRNHKAGSMRLIVSVWGNDFTLHAPSSPLMRKLTRDSVSAAQGLHADCRRDIRIAGQWGFQETTPWLVAPGNGGIRAEFFSHGVNEAALKKKLSLSPDKILLLNPRGLRGYARTDTFFQTVSLVTSRMENAHFLAVGMAGEPVAERWVDRLNLHAKISLLPPMGAEEMAALFRMSTASISLTEHDGTPNTLLEAMACGCLPICGNLESIREWIRDGENGLLVSSEDPRQAAEAVVRAVQDHSLRENAAVENRRLIAQRAEWRSVMPGVESFYHAVLEHD